MAAPCSAFLVSGSDEVKDTPCDSCSSDGKDADAVSYCEDCKSSFCSNCLKWHVKFLGESGHKMAEIKSQSQKTTSMHRSGPPPLPKRVQRSKTWNDPSQRVNRRPEAQHNRHMNQTKRQLLLGDMLRLRQIKRDLLNEVDNDETSNMALLKKLTNKITELVTAESEKIHGHARKTLKSELEELEARIEALRNGTTGDEEIDTDMIRKLRQSMSLNLESPLIEKTRNFLKDLESAKVSKPGLSAEFLCEYDVSVNSDKSVCGIYGSCLLADGMVVLTDNANKRLKLLNRKYGVCNHVDLPCGPWGVCCTNLYEVAVTLTNSRLVQFISLGKSITMTRVFGVKQHCRGICYSNCNLYISCGSLANSDPGFIGVFTLSGQLIRRIDSDQFGKPVFSVPHHIAATSRGDRFYIADKNNGAFLMSEAGDVTRFKDKDLVKAFGICSLDSGGFLVCGINSDTVLQVGDNGRKIGTLLSVADGIYGPYSLLVDTTDSTLTLTFYQSNKVKVYKLR